MTLHEINELDDTNLQEATDLAHCWTLFDSARAYGLVTGGPIVDCAHCEDVLRIAESRGTRPSEDAVERFVAGLQAESIARDMEERAG